MKKLLIIVLIGISLIGAGCGVDTTGNRSVSEAKQEEAANQITEFADYVRTNRQLIVDQVQVAEEGTKNWNTLMKLFDNLEGGSIMVGYLDEPYNKQEEEIQHLSAMALHFKEFMKDRSRSKEFSEGMKSLQEFDKIK